MAVASFEDLCAGLCELVKVSPPPLKADENGLIAFHIVLRGETVNFVYRPHTCPEHMFVLFDLGPLDHGTEESAAQLQALLDANYALLELNPPFFSRNPATGDAVLQYTTSLFEATPDDVYTLVDDGIAQIARWRQQVSKRGASTDESAATEGAPMAMLHRIA
jgi:hypothetical protein